MKVTARRFRRGKMPAGPDTGDDALCHGWGFDSSWTVREFSGSSETLLVTRLGG